MKLMEIFILFLKTNTLQKHPIVHSSGDVVLNVVDTSQKENAYKINKNNL